MLKLSAVVGNAFRVLRIGNVGGNTRAGDTSVTDNVGGESRIRVISIDRDLPSKVILRVWPVISPVVVFKAGEYTGLGCIHALSAHE